MANTTAPIPRRKRVAEQRDIPRTTALNKTESNLVNNAAKMLGVSVSSFLRNSALEAANTLVLGSADPSPAGPAGKVGSDTDD